MSDVIDEIVKNPEEDMSIVRSASMPLLLFKMCKKYGLSISECLQEGALMMLNRNDAFKDTDKDNFIYGSKGVYMEQVKKLTGVINKLTTGEKK